MLIKLIRNKPQGNAITGRLVIDGRWYCNTLERVGYQIPALCYHVAVTQSPKFTRLLPLVTGVPRTGDKAMRQGIRIHRGTKPEHSTGCILVVADNPSRAREFLSPFGRTITSRTIGAEVVENNVVEVVDNKTPVGCRSAADIESQLTQLLFQSQNEHEEIILEVTDFRAGTEYGYNTPCPCVLQKPCSHYSG